MIIDRHIHLIGATPSLQNLGNEIRTTVDGVAFISRHPEIYRAAQTEDPIDISGILLADMDRHNIDKALIQQRPGRGTNDMVADTVTQHPARFYGLLNIRGVRSYTTGDLPSEEDLQAARARAAEEIDRSAQKLGLIGLGGTGPRGFTLESHPERIARDLKPIWDAAARNHLSIEVGSAWSQFPGGQNYLDPVWTDELAGRYPQVPIIIGKMGRGTHHFETALSVALRNVNVYFDTVGTTGAHIRVAVDALGADRIMFGTDWSPTWRWLSDPADIYTMRKQLLDDAVLSGSERELIEWRTASRVYGLNLE